MTSLGRSPVDPFNQNSNSRDEVLSRKLKFESTFQDDTSQGGANNVKRFNLGEWILKRGERAQRAEQRVQENPFDTESWDHLAKEAHTLRIDDARPFYEILVGQFPTSGRYWRMYIDHEMRERNNDKVEKLFQKVLRKPILLIEIWRLYLSYIREAKAHMQSNKEQMAKAYDFALDKIGLDLQSYPIWSDYISFLRNVEAHGGFAENQKITACRRVFHRGIVNPMINIELFWKEYIKFEQEINPHIAEKMSQDRSREYMNARRVAKEYESVTRGLNKSAPAVPPLCTPDEARQIDLWRKYIAWEKSNPTRSEDPLAVKRRVAFAMDQRLLCLGHHIDAWIDYTGYLQETAAIMNQKGDAKNCQALQDETAAIFERAVTTFMISNPLIYFAYADFEESRQKKEPANKIYRRLLDENKSESFDPTLTYIQYMKFARRTEGVKAARAVFKLAREDPRTKAHAFIAAAMMEFFCGKDSNVATKIFEVALKRFPSDMDLIHSHLDFMTNLNDENNTRVLYERILTGNQISDERSMEVWTRFLEFESNVGDLASVMKVEKRRSQTAEKLSANQQPPSETGWLVDRYKFMDLMPCSTTELRCVGYVPHGPQKVSNMIQTTGPISGYGSGQVHDNTLNGTHHIAPTPNGDHHNHTGPQSSGSYSMFPRPDLRQMVPFKPVINPPPMSHSVPGGVFPPPVAVQQLLTMLPHPSCFSGPYVVVEKLVNAFLSLPLVGETFPVRADATFDKKEGMKFFNSALAASREGSLASALGSIAVAQKRAAAQADEEEAEPDMQSYEAPNFDIFRSRHMKRRKNFS